MSDYYKKYKAEVAQKPPRKLSPERARQNVVSTLRGLARTPKDFDWLAKNIPCQAACPAKTDIPGYLATIARGDYEGAYRINLRDNVFPAVLGRVCTRPCEPACRHGWEGLGEPVAICFSKRSAADFLSRKSPVRLEPIFPPTGKKVAVIGAGAAGLAAARDLALMGHVVTVYERHHEPGGLMVQGIPHFRLPRDLVALEIEQVRAVGVAIQCGIAVGPDLRLPDLLAGHDAIVLAVGTHAPNVPDLPGVEMEGVLHGLSFLKEVNATGSGRVGARVVVVGGGFTAVDCARTARRLGATSVRMCYRRSQSEMYITPGEVEDMEQEGIRFETHLSPAEIVGEKGRVTGVRFMRTEMGAPDQSGRRVFRELAGSDLVIEADTVLLGTGQVQEAVWRKEMVPDDPRIFLAGDCATGALSLIDAIAHGRGCAHRADAFLMGGPRLAEAVLVEDADETGRTRAMDAIPRQPMPQLEPAARALQREVDLGFAEETARVEASRCYLCHYKYEIDNDLCIYCDRCLKVKPVEHCIVKVSSLIYDGEGRITGYHRAHGSKDYNMLYIDQAQCIRCGACKDVCPVECITLQKVRRVTICKEDVPHAK